MPVKISALPAATALGGTETVPLVQGTTTKGGLISQIGTYVRGLFTTTPATIAEGGTGSATAPLARTALGLGTMAVQNATAIAVTGGTIVGTNVWSNTRLAKIAVYALANADKGKTVCLGGTAFYALTVAAASGFDSDYVVAIYNEDTGRGKSIQINGLSNFILWPLQCVFLLNLNNVWSVVNKDRWRVLTTPTFYVDTVSGLNTSDGLGTSGTGSFATVQFAIDNIFANIDASNTQPVIQVVAGSTITGAVLCYGQPSGVNPQIFINGNLNPGSQIAWTTTGNNQVLVSTRDNGILTVQGFAFSSAHTGCTALYASQQGIIDYQSITFGTFASGQHILIDHCCTVNCLDTSTLTTITGSATYHIRMMGAGANHTMGGATINMPNALAFTSFVSIVGPSCANWGLNAFSGTGSAGGSTGTKFALDGNAVFYKGGTTVPCATAGATTNGGQSL